MSDAGTAPAPASSGTEGSALGSLINKDEIRAAAEEARRNRELLQGETLALPGRLRDIRSQEASDIAKLGPVPQLTPEEMRSFLGKPPQPQQTGLLEQWGSPAMLLALIGSAFTRMPLTSALEAGAKVMGAYQQRDYDAAQEAYKEWKQHNDTALKLFSYQQDAYANSLKAIKEAAGEQKKDAIAEVSAFAHAFNDRPMMDAMALGRYDIATQLADERAQKFEDYKEKYNQGKKVIDAQNDYLQAEADLKQAQQMGDPEAIKAAEANLDEKKKAFDTISAAQAEARRGPGGSAGAGDSRGQAQRNAEITEARQALQGLLNNETVNYGGYEITPADFAEAESGIGSPLGPSDKQKAIARMRRFAGAPITHGLKAEPVPALKPEGAPKTPPGGTGGAPAAATGPSEKDKVLLDQADAAIAKGADWDKVRKVYIAEGGKDEDFIRRFPPKVGAESAGY